MNSCVALRPDPGDFDAWASTGGDDWSWEAVLPYFERIEVDADFPSASYHGSNGPLPVIRWRVDQLEPASRSFLEAALAAGHPWCDDLNAPAGTGVGLVPMNRRGNERVSAATAYLDPVRGLANLRIRPSTSVLKLTIRRDRVTGLVLDGPDGTEEMPAGNVVLCTGAYCTPWVLLRSGIGPGDDLQRAGVEVEVELPGVGRQLTDHSQCHVAAAWPRAGGCRPCLQTLVRCTTDRSSVDNDMQLCLLNYVEVAAYAPDMTVPGSPVVLCALLQHAESRGSVRLADNGQVHIELDYLAASTDVRRYRAGMRALWRIAEHMDAAFLTDRDVAPESVEQDELLDRIVSERVQTAHHPMGTARMGGDADPDAVVGTDLAVHGVAGLRVADASIIPVPIRANIHLTCLMIGEIAAERMRQDAA